MAPRSADSSPPVEDGPFADRWIRLGILLALLFLIALVLRVNQRPPDATVGVWVSDERPERLALELLTAKRLAAGTMHQLSGDKEIVQWGVAGAIGPDGALHLEWGNNATLSGRVDLETGVLEARVVPSEGLAYDMTFHRTEVERVPGLLAQPGLPYRLRPPAEGSGWQTASPSAVGIRPGAVEDTIRAVTRGEAGLLHSLLLIRHGTLVAEEYFHGYQRDDLHELQSATKSVTSLLVGIAVDRGLIADLDAPVLGYFPDVEIDDRTWRQITLRHLLTMRAGVDWKRDEVMVPPGTGVSFFRQVFLRRIAAAPGSPWLYNGADVNLLAGVLHRATGMHADAFAERYLFAPLGIKAWNWETDKRNGYPSLAGTLELRPLDMARIGQLVLDEGHWQGESVVSEEWIEESTAPQVATNDASRRYGYLWWRESAPIGEGEYPVIVASGLGSQLIHIVPDLDAVVVTTGGNQLNNKTFLVGDVLVRHLLPGVEPRS